MGFELKYYVCPKCNAEKLAKNLDNGTYVCDNSEGGCTNFISKEKAFDYFPEIGCNSFKAQKCPAPPANLNYPPNPYPSASSRLHDLEGAIKEFHDLETRFNGAIIACQPHNPAKGLAFAECQIQIQKILGHWNV
jgi:hypothetical protein